MFDPSLVYTFYFWQHMLDVTRHRLDVGFASFDLRPHIPGQPLKLMGEWAHAGSGVSGRRVWQQTAVLSCFGLRSASLWCSHSTLCVPAPVCFLRPSLSPSHPAAKTRPGGDYLWCFELWHESALARDKAAAKM